MFILNRPLAQHETGTRTPDPCIGTVKEAYCTGNVQIALLLLPSRPIRMDFYDNVQVHWILNVHIEQTTGTARRDILRLGC